MLALVLAALAAEPRIALPEGTLAKGAVPPDVPPSTVCSAEVRIAGGALTVGDIAPGCVASLETLLRDNAPSWNVASADSDKEILFFGVDAEGVFFAESVPTPVIARRIDPKYPPAAKKGNYGPVACKAHFEIGTDGLPTSVDVRDCPPEFAEPTKETLLTW